MITVSAVLSIHNRAELFRRALEGYLWQSLPRDQWEILLIDDMSTEDQSVAYQDYLGKINLRHIYMDHTKHPVFKDRNPNWKPGEPEDWFHTPALSINLGCSLARGSVICLCHPEILHRPSNFEVAARRLLSERHYLIGLTYLGTQASNEEIKALLPWTRYPWDHAMAILKANRLECFQGHYWYTSFLAKAAVEAARGVDFTYLHGVAGEDDDFRDRVGLAGWPWVYAEEIQGFHQDHSHEKEPHRRRDTERWQAALKRNREIYHKRRLGSSYPMPSNHGYDWTASETFVREVEYRIGSMSPVVTEC